MLRMTLWRSFLTAKMMIMTFKWTNSLATLITLLLTCQTSLVPCLQWGGVILTSQTHAPAVDYTSVEVMAGGDSESCEKFDCFEK